MRWAIAIMLLWMPVFVQAKPLDADLAVHSVDIDHDFQGMDILLFGARNDVGQVLVTLRGPENRYLVRKKERVMGVWANTESVTFERVPSAYSIASTAPLESLQNDNLLDVLEIGIEHLPMVYAETDISPYKAGEFWQALVDAQISKGLYTDDILPVNFWGETLFRTELPFSKHIERGWHTADAFLITDGTLSSVLSTPIEVRKIGLEALLYDMAHERPIVYGLLSVLMAIVAGWTASRLFGILR